MERRYTVVGTGALGGYYGSRLHHAGLDVRFLLRSDFDHVCAHGLRVESPEGDFSIPAPQAFGTPGDLPLAEVVLLCLKTTGNHQLAELLPPAVGAGATVVVMQNGLGVEAEVAALLPDHPVLGGLSFLCSNKIGPGHIRHIDYGQVRFGAFSETGDARGITAEMEAIGSDFERAGIPVILEEDLTTARWKKLVWNIPYNGLCTVQDTPTDALMAESRLAAEVKALMAEVLVAARACGADIPEDFAEKMREDTVRMGAYLPSMLIDRRENRPLELEAIYQRPLAAARSAGVACPRIEDLYARLRALD